MELELLAAEEAAAKPAGRAREEPNQNPKLPEPKCVSRASFSRRERGLFLFLSDEKRNMAEPMFLFLVCLRTCVTRTLVRAAGRPSHSWRSRRPSNRSGTSCGRASSGTSSPSSVSSSSCSSSRSSYTRFRCAIPYSVEMLRFENLLIIQ